MESFAIEPVLTGIVTAGIRISGVMVFAPFLGSESVAMPVKAGFTLTLTALLYPACRMAPMSFHSGAWAGVAVSELIIGMLLGFGLQLALDAVQFAGQLTGLQMGFSLVNVMDPQTQVDTPVLAIFYQLIALLIFLQLNVHRWLLRGLAASFAYVPPGSARLHFDLTADLLRSAAGIWLAGLEIAAPLVVATMMTDVALGFLGKASPQLPVLFLGLSIKSTLSLVVLIGTLALWPGWLEPRFAAALSLGERWLHLAR